MDVFIVLPLIIALLVLKYYLTDHDTRTDKDRKRYIEGILLFENGDNENAFAYFDCKLKEERKSAIAYIYRGKCHLKYGNLHSALYDFTEALSFDNSLTDVHLERGKILYQLENYHDAFLSFDKAVWFSRGQKLDALAWRNLVHQKLNSVAAAKPK